MSLTMNTAPDWTKTKTAEVALWVEKEFNIPGFANLLCVRVSTSTRRRASWGGISYKKGACRPFVSLAIWYQLTCSNFTEYRQFANHTVIGNIQNNQKASIAALICHEVAHAIDHYTQVINQVTQVDQLVQAEMSSIQVVNTPLKGHGARWQTIYAILRKQFVNNGVTDVAVKEAGQRRSTQNVQKIEPRKDAIVVKQVKGRSGVLLAAYMTNGKTLAYGRRVPYGTRNIFVMYNLEGEIIKTMENGRGARRWVKENLM